MMIPPRPDPISHEARRLIDDAVAQGRVRRIPTGVSGLPLPGTRTVKEYRASIRRTQARNIRMERAAKKRASDALGLDLSAFDPGRTSRVTARKELILLLFNKAVLPRHMPAVIERELGVNVSMGTVYNDIKALRAQGRLKGRAGAPEPRARGEI
ncbi:hypothetical protein [Ruegeria sp.]|uniref:hypothetical protein n=1 Tax=Ruegeria sp. TaxID=1879320 RepID=UPI003B59B625